MKFVFLLGGAGGFLTAAATDYFSQRSPDRILLDGAIGCLVGSMLFKWFWNVLINGVRDTYIARHLAAQAPAVPPPPPAPVPAAVAPNRTAAPAPVPVKTR